MRFSQFFIIILSFVSTYGFSQEKKDSKPNRAKGVYKNLFKDSVKANKVEIIMSDYKSKMKAVALTNISEEEKRTRFKALIGEKNIKLEGILTKEELRKIISSTDTTARKK